MNKQKDEAIYRKGWDDGFAKGAAAARFQLEAENAELRRHVRMPDEPLEIDEKDFYARAFIKWAIEEQPEVKRLEAENDKLRELLDYITPIAWHAASENERDRLRELGVEV